MDSKTIKKANVKLVMEALNDIGKPASARDVVEHIAQNENVNSVTIRDPVMAVLKRGYTAGFLEKDGDAYVPVAMQAAMRMGSKSRKRTSRSRSASSRSRSRRRSTQRSRSRSRRSRY